MKEGISLTTLFKALVAFTLIFTAFLSLAIIYNKAYKLKNETLSILEKYEGANQTSLAIINNYLYQNGYQKKGTCELGEFGNDDLNSPTLELVTSNKNKYYYCLAEICTSGRCVIEDNNKIYFRFKLFFGFDLPYFSDILTFTIKGETKKIKFYDRNQILS